MKTPADIKMNKRLFEKLLKRPESATLDFKEQSYSFKKEDSDEDAKFIKDVLSFCNTVRKETAYIISGVRHTAIEVELPGISNFTDDAIFQQKAKDKIWPKPVFQSYTYRYKGNVFGVIEFPIQHYNMPLESVKPMKGVLMDTIYLRRSSGNASATPKETIELHQWLQTIPSLSTQVANTKDEHNTLIATLSNRDINLSVTMSSVLTFAKRAKHKELLEFAVHEVKGYYDLKEGKMNKYKFRICRLIATPYEIELPRMGVLSADQMMVKLRADDHFRDIDYFFNNALVDLEGMMANFNSKQPLATFSFPYKKVFPEITSSSVPNATLFFGLQDLTRVYESIRKIAIEKLVNMQL